MSSLVAVVLGVGLALGATFGDASATAVAAGPEMMEVELSVALGAEEGPVLAHLFLPGEPRSTHPLLDRGNGTWSTVVEVRRADWQVVFEAVTSGELSDPVPLTALGVDPDLLSDPTTVTTVPPPAATPPWGMISLASGAAGAALLLYLVAGGSLTPRHLR